MRASTTQVLQRAGLKEQQETVSQSKLDVDLTNDNSNNKFGESQAQLKPKNPFEPPRLVR